MSDWIQDRMLGYYPEVIKDIYDIQAVIDGEYPEFKLLNEEYIESVQNNAYLLTMDEERIEQWIDLLELDLVSDSTIEDKRDAIIAKIRGTGKLNTQLINKIVHTFTEGDVESYFRDSTVYVKIYPPSGNKEYKYVNIKRELQKRIPAHLGFNVKRAFCVWHNIKIEFNSWNDILNGFGTWEDVMLYVTQNKIKWKNVQDSFRNWDVICNDFINWTELYLYRV